MNFIPFQKYVVIEKIKEEDDLISNQSQFEKAKVIKVSSEISNIKEEDIVFIPSFAGDVYIENDKGYMKTTCLKNFVNEYSDLGYSRKEILENLKMCGLLLYDKDRSYDSQISIDGKKVRFYIILLPKPEESGVK